MIQKPHRCLISIDKNKPHPNTSFLYFLVKGLSPENKIGPPNETAWSLIYSGLTLLPVGRKIFRARQGTCSWWSESLPWWRPRPWHPWMGSRLLPASNYQWIFPELQPLESIINVINAVHMLLPWAANTSSIPRKYLQTIGTVRIHRLTLPGMRWKLR